MTATLNDEVAELRRANAELQQRLDERTADLRESLEYQTATSNVLKVISGSTFDIQPVFETIVATAARLCDADIAGITNREGDTYRMVATFAASPEYDALMRGRIFPANRETTTGRAALEGRIVHIADIAAEPGYTLPESVTVANIRTNLGVPLLRDGVVLGVISVGRTRVQPFTDRQIELVRTFADQAVIAIENARLITETREALDQQTATAEVLGVINSSPGDLAPVFDAMLEKALRLCEAPTGHLLRYADGSFSRAASLGIPEDFDKLLPLNQPLPHVITRDSVPYRTLETCSPINIADLREDDSYRAGAPAEVAAGNEGGVRSVLFVPLLKDGEIVGNFVMHRLEVRPFTEKQIALLENFAAQAVIAMENARLITETREALDQQTATAEVLEIIASSPGRLEPVFKAVLANAVRICGGTFGMLGLRDGDGFRGVAAEGVNREISDNLSRLHDPPPGTGLHRLQVTQATVQIADCAAEPAYDPVRAANPPFAAVRTALHVPMLKERDLLGAILIYRDQVLPFTENEVELVENFAKQAAIAIENARLITETREALDQQTATAEVLGVINSSPGNLVPVFEAMLEKATRLCEAAFGIANTYDGEGFHTAALHEVPRPLAELWLSAPPVPGPNSPLARIARGEEVVHIEDFAASPGYAAGEPRPRAMVELGGAHSYIAVALRKDGKLLGTLAAFRQEVRPFTDKQIALLQNFAAQAVIAMENARLIAETQEALDQQTATAEVLGVINSSPGDLAPVFEAILEKAHSLCGSTHGNLSVFDGEHFRAVATHGLPKPFAGLIAQPYPAYPGSLEERLVAGDAFVHIPDVPALGSLPDNPIARAAIEFTAVRTVLLLPLRKDGALLGYLSAHRREVSPFTDKQIALLQNFAAQAVIAIENARLITETREALDQQTATAEVLQVINSSPGDLGPVFSAILEKSASLCGAAFGVLLIHDGLRFRHAALRNVPTAYAEFMSENPPDYGAESGPGRVLATERLVHVVDMKDTDLYRAGEPNRRAAVDLAGARTALLVPLLKDETVRGLIVVFRKEVRPFSDKQIALLQNFAAQAVIAMENARLLTETREALEQQTATSEVLQVISRSTFDLDIVLKTVVSTARRLCRADYSVIFRNEGGEYRFASGEGNVHEYEERERLAVISPGRGTIIGRAALEGRAVQILDALADPEYAEKDHARVGGARTMLGVPLLREGEVIGALGLARNRIEGFSDREVELVATFADQAVIAMENVRLITETREARDEAEKALRDLRAAQANLVQAEKMASLGQLTAGIAHEIKNPLNFVNNFASLSVELLDELKETTAPAVAALGDDKRAEVDETMVMLTGNLEKIAEHGKRADNIVKSMLEHSRGVSGERREVDLNQLIEEALNLAYHGARAQDQTFNITLERNYAGSLKPIEVAPQEITRVFLNLFGNGFYAANKRLHGNGEGASRPTLSVATRDDRDAVEVRVRDNGTGIPPDIKDKLFQPFFTTKPTGEGTGLGLSISYDIVTQQHGGTITVDSRVGEFTEFTVRLPRH